ncbi:MAG: YaeQ family protein [Fibrobacteres bacterium]|nr:YaeQ family protein [Fibrobacterota bacterium]
MAQPVSLHRFQIDFSDIDRGVYKAFDLRLARHPSESETYLLTRLIAYILNDREYLEFSPGGLSDPDAPCIQAATPHGEILLWIEIGNPSARKLHKASKAARQVRVYTYKDVRVLLEEIRGNKVHKAETIEVFSLEAKFLEGLAPSLERTNKWSLLHQEGTLTVTIGNDSSSCELLIHPIQAA